MRKITMKRKTKSVENVSNSNHEESDDALPKEEQDSNSSQENGTSKRNKGRKSKAEVSFADLDDENSETESSKKNKRKSKAEVSFADENTDIEASKKNKRKSKVESSFVESEEENSDLEVSKKNKNRKSKAEVSFAEHSDETNEAEKRSKKKNKRGRKPKSNNGPEESNGTEEGNDDEDESYEVEQVLEQKFVKGAKYFLIRWKGYGQESDTWEPESTLDCSDLVAKFLSSLKSDDTAKRVKKRGSQSNNKSPSTKKVKANDEAREEVGEYEVDRILEVHFKKSGKREFLVHWKGYSSTDNTWEPEENMSCHHLIDKFMEKVNKARATDTRELRVNRAPTKHFTLSMQQHGRRLSRRNLGKQRAQYNEMD